MILLFLDSLMVVYTHSFLPLIKKGIHIVLDIAFGGVFFEVARRKVILTKFKLHKKYNNNLY